MQQMPKRKEESGMKSTCLVCGNPFSFVSAIFVDICNDCRKTHPDRKE